MLLQGDPRARQPAHDRADRHAGHLRRLLVAQPLHRHEHQRRPLVRRQPLDRLAHLGQRQPRLDAPHRLVRPQPLLGNLAVLLADLARAELVDPDRLHDAEHPAVEPRTLLKLMLPRQRPLARRLDQIVGLGRRSARPRAKRRSRGSTAISWSLNRVLTRVRAGEPSGPAVRHTSSATTTRLLASYSLDPHSAALDRRPCHANPTPP